MPISFVVLNHAQPGRGHEYLDLVTPVLDAMRHESSFINTVLHRSTDDLDLFMLYETWADRTDFETVQMRRPYRAAYEAALPGLLRKPREIVFFEPLRADYTFFHGGRLKQLGSGVPPDRL